jgi:hypothetical protein
VRDHGSHQRRGFSPSGSRAWRFFELSKCEEVADRHGDLSRVRLKRKVPGVEEAHGCVRDVARKRFGARRQKEWVVSAPGGEKAGLVFAEICLKSRIQVKIDL